MTTDNDSKVQDGYEFPARELERRDLWTALWHLLAQRPVHADTLKFARKACGLTQGALSDQVGWSLDDVMAFESATLRSGRLYQYALIGLVAERLWQGGWLPELSRWGR